ncbi:low molecular weight phosphotyrosine protein phosphatase [Orbaceae bacterium ESL0727]|nr:low molecular weight phosphotyrosine protein phosphatase [Orbaceae bacterium ESL0727]
MFDSICVVCVGNICRSPIGERMLQKAFPTKKITSAGIAAEVGQPAYSKSVLVAQEHGLSLEGHIAKQLTKSLCQEQDLILVMETSHIDAVCRFAPEVRGKVMLYGHWLNNGTEIADPYGQSMNVFEQTYLLLDKSTKLWINKFS